MSTFIKITFPEAPIRERMVAECREAFDPVRKLWVSLTPEEWVRQNFISFLISEGYPNKLIAVEKKIMVGAMTKRCDIVVYSRSMQPLMIVECKRMDIPLSQTVLDQVLRYHIPLQPTYLIITNGTYTMGFRKKNGQFLPIDTFPKYENT